MNGRTERVTTRVTMRRNEKLPIWIIYAGSKLLSRCTLNPKKIINDGGFHHWLETLLS
jgi:hypothetical protein